MSTDKPGPDLERASYGAKSQADFTGDLPQPFPRQMGPRAMEYLAEVVDSGLTCDMVGRFESAFAGAHGKGLTQLELILTGDDDDD